MGTITAAHTVDIESPIQEVFDFVSDQANEPTWHTDVLEANPAKPLAAGATVIWLVDFMGQNTYVNEVTAYEPPHRIELTAREGPLKPVLTHTFESNLSGTSYTREVQIPLEGAFRIVGPVMRIMGAARRRNARFAENLKTTMTGATKRT